MADGKYERSEDFPFDIIMKEVWKTARADLKVDGEDAKLADIAVEYYDCDKKLQSLRREVNYIIFGDKNIKERNGKNN